MYSSNLWRKMHRKSPLNVSIGFRNFLFSNDHNKRNSKMNEDWSLKNPPFPSHHMVDFSFHFITWSIQNWMCFFFKCMRNTLNFNNLPGIWFVRSFFCWQPDSAGDSPFFSSLSQTSSQLFPSIHNGLYVGCSTLDINTWILLHFVDVYAKFIYMNRICGIKIEFRFEL